jgi:hypothetical protein
MITTIAANDAPSTRPSAFVNDEALGMNLPVGLKGPIQLSQTGRTVWWTGRVAIGLRFKPTRHGDSMGQSALLLQDMMLKRA